jgi:transcriptional regulator with XRE-family HTH domain
MDAGHEPAAGGTSERAAKKRARGTVAMNGLALNQARVDRGWTQEALAEKVGVNLRTLQRAEAGQPVERETAGWIAEALGIPLLMLLKDAPSLASAAGGTPPKGRETVEIVLNIDPGKCSSAELPRLVSNAVAELSDNVLVQGVVLLVRVVMGSIRIILEVDKEDADRLLEAFKKGELAYLDVANVTLASRQRPSHLYPAFLCFLSIGCAFLAIIPAIRVYAAGVGLALGVVDHGNSRGGTQRGYPVPRPVRGARQVRPGTRRRARPGYRRPRNDEEGRGAERA